jgi:hypothetical protein
VIFKNFGSKAAPFAAVVERTAAEVRDSLDELAARQVISLGCCTAGIGRCCSPEESRSSRRRT